MMKFPNKLGLIIEADGNEKRQTVLKKLTNPKFMMPNTFTAAEVLQLLRQRLDLNKEDGLVLFANGRYLLKPSQKLEDVYTKYKDEDGFLYLTYSEEQVFG